MDRMPGAGGLVGVSFPHLREFFPSKTEFMIYYWRFGEIGTCSFRHGKQIPTPADMGSIGGGLRFPPPPVSEQGASREEDGENRTRR